MTIMTKILFFQKQIILEYQIKAKQTALHENDKQLRKFRKL